MLKMTGKSNSNIKHNEQFITGTILIKFNNIAASKETKLNFTPLNDQAPRLQSYCIINKESLCQVLH